MFFVRIDNVSDKNVTGFECGTRAEFDQRHATDPLWVFVDADKVRHRIDLPLFIRTPTLFLLDANNALKKKMISQ